MEAQSTYYITNQSVYPELLFRQPENYQFFYQKCLFFLTPIAEIHSCFLSENTYHLLVTIKDIEYVKNLSKLKQHKRFNANKTISKQFSNVMNCYAQAYNKRFERNGSLFKRGLYIEEINEKDELEELKLILAELPEISFSKFSKSL